MLRRLSALAVALGLLLVAPWPDVRLAVWLWAAAVSDNFDRTAGDSLGANWTEASGDADIFSNTLRLSTGSFGVVNAIYTGTALDDEDQYIKASLGADCQFPWFSFRNKNSSGSYYAVQIDCNIATFTWYYFSDWSDTSGDEIGTLDLAGDVILATIGITLCGTGTATVVRVWVSPTNLPTACDDWDGDTSPNGSITDDPATAVDTGSYAGLGGQQGAADTVRLDNFFAGDFGGGGGATRPPGLWLRGGIGQ